MFLSYKVSTRSIFTTARIIQEITNTAFELQSDYMKERYERIYSLTKSRTMVATGELRSKLFIRCSNYSARYARFICGYGSTSNDQAYHQEFDTFGKVHHSKREHYRSDGRAKCSRRPVDLFARFGGYGSNRSARRKALASSAGEVLGTQVSYVVDHGAVIRYEPDLSNVVRKLVTITRAVVNA